MSNIVYNYPLQKIDGGPLDLSSYKGKKILLVNTASACGFTPQYAQLEELYQHYKDKLVVVGLPCNDFGEQEPGTEQEIAQFCDLTYHVTFPMTAKVKILGADPHPLYNFLMKKELNGYRDSEVKWNFQKYLINENGNLVKIFGPQVEPLSDDILNLVS